MVQPKEKSRKNRRGIKNLTMLFAVITLLVWIILLFLKCITSGFNFSQLFDDVLANILGILLPILIFNFAYEYFTQEYISEEIAEQITSTLMSNASIISLFEEEQKRNFLTATLSSIVDKERFEMVNNILAPYLSTPYNIKKEYNYLIILREAWSKNIFDPSRYIQVEERLLYRKVYTENSFLPNKFNIGFFTKNSDLDRELRGSTYFNNLDQKSKRNNIFVESLLIYGEDLKKIIDLPDDDKKKFVTDQMLLRVLIDTNQVDINDVKIDEFGIDIELVSNHSQSKKEFSIEISFIMPQIRKKSTFLVSINEPTYSPSVVFSYPEGSMNVIMFPFINDGSNDLVNSSMHSNGICTINIPEKWAHPLSGVLFIIEEKEVVGLNH